jgi:hypothetical protein
MGDGMYRATMQYAYTGRLQGTTQSELHSSSYNTEDGESMFLGNVGITPQHFTM